MLWQVRLGLLEQAMQFAWPSALWVCGLGWRRSGWPAAAAAAGLATVQVLRLTVSTQRARRHLMPM